MSATLTSYGATYFLNALFGGRQAVPGAYWLALLAQAPGAQTNGSMLVEPDPQAGYARTLLTNNTFGFSAAATGVIASAADGVFPVATDDWVTVSHWALCDAQVQGNVFLYGSFSTPRKVRNGDVARIPAGTLHLSLATLAAAQVSAF